MEKCHEDNTSGKKCETKSSKKCKKTRNSPKQKGNNKNKSNDKGGDYNLENSNNLTNTEILKKSELNIQNKLKTQTQKPIKNIDKRNSTRTFQNKYRSMSFDELLKSCTEGKSVYDQPSRSDIEKCKNTSKSQRRKSVIQKCSSERNYTMSFDDLLKSYSEKLKFNDKRNDVQADNKIETRIHNIQSRESVIQSCKSTDKTNSFDELLKSVSQNMLGDVSQQVKYNKSNKDFNELLKIEENMVENGNTSQFEVNKLNEGTDGHIEEKAKVDEDLGIDVKSEETIESENKSEETIESGNRSETNIKATDNGLDDLGDLVRYINDDINVTVKVDMSNDFSDIPTTDSDVSPNELQSNLYLVSNSLDSSSLPILAF